MSKYKYKLIFLFTAETKPVHQRANADGKPERNFNKFNNENREERNNRRNREDRQFNGPAEGNR